MTNHKQEWEKEFDKEFSHVGWIPENKAHVKSFISSIREQARKEAWEQQEEKWETYTKTLLAEAELDTRRRIEQATWQVIDKIKRKYNGFGGILGFTQCELLSLLSNEEEPLVDSVMTQFPEQK